MNWIDLAQDRDKLGELVKVEMNFQVIKMPEFLD